MKETTEDSFATDILSKEKVLLKLGAGWCGACSTIKGPLDEAVEETQIEAFSVDVDTNPNLTQQFNIRNLPTLLFFRNGNIINRHVGMADKETLRLFIEAN